MDKTHPITMADTEEDTIDPLESGRRKQMLEALKKEIGLARVIATFKSPEDLRAHVLGSLAGSRPATPAANGTINRDFDIPPAPEFFKAHPYTLLAPADLVGRRRELALLTDWGRGVGTAASARLMHIIAIGGMGKSALTWKWFTEIAPQEMTLAGRMWWSFYESAASFENFVIDALAYTAGMAREAVRKLSQDERERQLLAILDRQPFLIALDGLERVLNAYARLDAARLRDDDYDCHTANYVRGVYDLPAGAEQSFTGEHRLRLSADPRADHFLRKLAQVRASRVLVSSRLYPAALQEVTYAPKAGNAVIFLRGLSDDDAVDLARRNGLSGEAEAMLRIFRQFDNYPLIIRAFAGEVARYKRAPGDFGKWLAANPDFARVLTTLRHEDAKSHVLAYALKGLKSQEKSLLQTIAAFRMPVSMDTLAALLIDPAFRLRNRKPFRDFDGLDDALKILEDRGLVGWDRAANRYDLHPIVRAVAWGAVDESARARTYEGMRGHFASLPTVDEDAVESLDDLASAIELYTTLIGLRRFDDALVVFRDRLDDATLYRLSAARQRVELLEPLFPDGLEALPRLTQRRAQGYTLNALALAYQNSGQPGRAIPLFARGNAIDEADDDRRNLSVGLLNLAEAARLAGALRRAEASARRALRLSQEANDEFKEAVSLYILGRALAARGAHAEGMAALDRARALFIEQNEQQSEGLTNAYLAQAALWAGDASAARGHADRAWELAHVRRAARDFIRAARLQGAAALALGDLATADAKLHDALTRARAINLAEEELPALVGLAELARRRGDPALAREHLDAVWDGAERGPYPSWHADALNVLAQVERDAGNREAAVAAADRAYRLAWCDGVSADGTVSYAYAHGLATARAHLEALGAPIPALAPLVDA